MTEYNVDHARNILTTLKNCEYSSAWSLLGMLDLEQLEITTEEAITYFGWLRDLGYVEGDPETTANCLAPLDFYQLRLTGQGVIFLQTFENPDFFDRVKRRAVELGYGMAPNILMMVAQRIVTGGG